VRYAWQHNPIEDNLYNKAGLPASGFSTQAGAIEIERLSDAGFLRLLIEWDPQERERL